MQKKSFSADWAHKSPYRNSYLRIAGLGVLLSCAATPLTLAASPASAGAAIEQQTSQATGVVLDESGQPLVGVTVQVKGTQRGTITDYDGKFAIDIKPGETLEFSYIGYTSVTAKGASHMKITLKEDLQNLDEVVVVGYGSTTKRAMIASVSSVNTKQMENLPAVNITQSLAGRSPGLIVKASGGGINKNSQISIRGGSTPLVVIDGVIREYSDFTTLSADDIESMSILKDASATAVYGSRAGNGILQITTKSGSANAMPSINYSFNQSWSQPYIWAEKLSSYELAYYNNMVADLYGLKHPYTDEAVQKYKDHSDLLNYPDTDWNSLVLRNFAPTQKHNFSISGGNKMNKFYAALGYIDQESLYRSNSHNMQRYNFRLTEDTNIEAIGLNLNAQIDGYVQDEVQPVSSTASYNYDNPYYYVFSHIANNSAMATALNEYGLIYTSPGDHPLAETSSESGYGKRKNTVVNGKVGAIWSLPWVKGLSLRATGSYRYWGWHEKVYQKDCPRYDLGSQTPVTTSSPQLTVRDQNGYAYTVQAFADYTNTFGKHTVSGLVGYESSYDFYNTLEGKRVNYVFDMDQLNSGPTANLTNAGTEAESGRAGWIFQAKYNYANKYFVEGSIRYDGSDQFPKDKRWGTFYSASLGWSVIDEDFMAYFRDNNIFNSLKLRGSYGEVGLDNWDSSTSYYLSRFAYLASYNYTANQYVIGGSMQPGLSEGSLPSPDISWFTTRQADFGVDFASLNNRLYGSIDYFYYSTKGFLYSPDALTVGYTDPLGTSLPKVVTDGEERRAGWEFQFGWRDRIGAFEYDLSTNFTYFDKMWALNPAESLESKKNPYSRTTQRKGYYGSLYNCLGYYTSADQIINSVQPQGSKNLSPGDLMYEDFNGDGLIDSSDMYNQGKNSFPRGLYGVNLNMRYKGFNLAILVQGTTRFDTQIVTGGLKYTYNTDFWRPDNTNAKYPRLLGEGIDNGGNNGLSSNFYLINSRYCRLKDVRFSYDFKHKLLKNVKWLSRLEAVVSGQNLLTISPLTKYGLDPENASTENYSYPLERTFAVGINLGF